VRRGEKRREESSDERKELNRTASKLAGVNSTAPTRARAANATVTLMSST
jgi:hypothetical protein